MTHRSEKVEQFIKEELSLIIQREVRDPRIGFVSITDVEVSVDLRHARVFVSVLGDGEDPREDAVRVGPFVAHAGHGDLGPAAIVLVIDLRGRHIELLVQSVEQTLQDAPLVLQARAAGQAEFKAQHADDHGLAARSGLRRFLADLVRLEDVSDLNVVEPFHSDAALKTFGHLAHVLLESPQ